MNLTWKWAYNICRPNEQRSFNYVPDCHTWKCSLSIILNILVSIGQLKRTVRDPGTTAKLSVWLFFGFTQYTGYQQQQQPQSQKLTKIASEILCVRDRGRLQRIASQWEWNLALLLSDEMASTCWCFIWDTVGQPTSTHHNGFGLCVCFFSSHHFYSFCIWCVRVRWYCAVCCCMGEETVANVGCHRRQLTLSLSTRSESTCE